MFGCSKIFSFTLKAATVISNFLWHQICFKGDDEVKTVATWNLFKWFTSYREMRIFRETKNRMYFRSEKSATYSWCCRHLMHYLHIRQCIGTLPTYYGNFPSSGFVIYSDDILYVGEVVAPQLTAQSHSIPEDLGLNPVIGPFNIP